MSNSVEYRHRIGVQQFFKSAGRVSHVVHHAPYVDQPARNAHIPLLVLPLFYKLPFSGIMYVTVEHDGAIVLMIAFDLNATETYQRTFPEGSKPKTSRTPVFPAGWQDQFGLPYKEHQQSMQINIFDGYAIYSIKDTSASEAADEVKQDTADPQAPSQQYSPEVRP